jgi:hypothetical protein
MAAPDPDTYEDLEMPAADEPKPTKAKKPAAEPRNGKV